MIRVGWIKKNIKSYGIFHATVDPLPDFHNFLKRWLVWLNLSRKLKTLISHFVGGQVRFPGSKYFELYVQNIFKEEETNFPFKVLAKLGDSKQNKDITRIVETIIILAFVRCVGQFLTTNNADIFFDLWSGCENGTTFFISVWDAL